jgi:hypothetical protein
MFAFFKKKRVVEFITRFLIDHKYEIDKGTLGQFSVPIPKTRDISSIAFEYYPKYLIPKEQKKSFVSTIVVYFVGGGWIAFEYLDIITYSWRKFDAINVIFGWKEKWGEIVVNEKEETSQS